MAFPPTPLPTLPSDDLSVQPAAVLGLDWMTCFKKEGIPGRLCLPRPLHLAGRGLPRLIKLSPGVTTPCKHHECQHHCLDQQEFNLNLFLALRRGFLFGGRTNM